MEPGHEESSWKSIRSETPGANVKPAAEFCGVRTHNFWLTQVLIIKESYIQPTWAPRGSGNISELLPDRLKKKECAWWKASYHTRQEMWLAQRHCGWRQLKRGILILDIVLCASTRYDLLCLSMIFPSTNPGQSIMVLKCLSEGAQTCQPLTQNKLNLGL